MAKYIIKRVFMLIPILIGVTLLVFILLSFTPGDTARLVLGSTATEEQLEMFREEHGLNDPLLVQYAEYMLGVVRGNLGTSYATRQAVSDMIGARVGYTPGVVIHFHVPDDSHFAAIGRPDGGEAKLSL